MSRKIRWLFAALVTVLTALVLSGCYCGDEIEADKYTGKAKVYALHSVPGSEVHGYIKFIERTDSLTLILVYLKGTTSGNWHPALIHSSYTEKEGDYIINLQQVNGKNGLSETLVKQKNDGGFLDYARLVELNGHVTVHLNESQMGTVVAKGDIGGQ